MLLMSLRNAIIMYAQDGKLPDIKQRAEGLFVYPQLTVHWYGMLKKKIKQELICLSKSGNHYSTTITNPTFILKII